MTRSLLLGSFLPLLPTSLAPAAVTVYTDRAAFESAIGPHVTYTFDPVDGFPVAPAQVTSLGPVHTWIFTVGSRAFIRSWPLGSSNQTLSGSYDAIVTSPLLLTFPKPISGVAFDMYINGGEADFDVTFSDGSFSDFGLPLDLGGATFFGMISDVAISSIFIWNAGDHRSQRYKGIDNLTVIPEPGFLATAISFAAALYRRRHFPRDAARYYVCDPLEPRCMLARWKNGDAHSFLRRLWVEKWGRT